MREMRYESIDPPALAFLHGRDQRISA
jgi:hypothetical protein